MSMTENRGLTTRSGVLEAHDDAVAAQTGPPVVDPIHLDPDLVAAITLVENRSRSPMATGGGSTGSAYGGARAAGFEDRAAAREDDVVKYSRNSPQQDRRVYVGKLILRC